MMLKSEITGWKVRYATGEPIGTVKDLVVNTKKPHWPVKALVVSPGVGKGTRLMDLPVRTLELDPHQRLLVQHGRIALRAEEGDASSLDHLRLNFLDGAKVCSSDEKLLGKAYDFAIATAPASGWLVWRFLVAVPGVRSRRLRLALSDIDTMSKGKIVLKMTKDDATGIA